MMLHPESGEDPGLCQNAGVRGALLVADEM